MLVRASPRVVIGATNRLDLLDDALLRPGRFDRLVEIPLPDEAARAACADRTEGWSGADLAAVAREASLLAIRAYVEAGGDPDDADAVAAARVEGEHWEAALEKIRRRRG